MKEFAETPVSYGYLRVQALLRRGGWEIDTKKIREIYNGFGPQLRISTSSGAYKRSFATTAKKPRVRTKCGP